MKKRGFNIKLPKERSFIGPASLFKRFIAYFIDLVIINFTIISPFGKIIKRLIPPAASFSETYQYIQAHPEISNVIAVISIAVGIMMVLYFTVFEYLTHQTPGKMLMKQYIIKDRGPELRFINYLISNLTFIPIFPFILLWIIDPIYMIISPKNQRWMEKISRILVVETYGNF